MKMRQTECSEMSAYKIQTPGNYPKQSIQQAVVCFNGERKEGDGRKKGTEERTMGMEEEDTKEIIFFSADIR